MSTTRTDEVVLATEANRLYVTVRGKLTHESYRLFVPVVERLVRQHRTIRVLFVMEDFHGWTPRALWDDIVFDIKHFRDVERIAIVGSTWWQQGMAAFCRPFTTAELRYFDHDDLEEARRWLAEGGLDVPTVDRIPELLAGLDDTNCVRRESARRRLVQIGEPAVDHLDQAASSERRRLRWEATKALASIGGPRVSRRLVQRLFDDSDIRWIAAEGLKRAGEDGLREVLLALKTRFASDALRLGAHHVLHDLDDAELHELVKPVLEALEQRQLDPVHVAVSAAEVLEKLDAREAPTDATTEHVAST